MGRILGARPDGTVMMLGFPYDDMHSERMADRAQTAYDAALADYNEKDTIKDAEPTEW